MPHHNGPPQSRNSAWVATFDDDIPALPHSPALGDFAMLSAKRTGIIRHISEVRERAAIHNPDQPWTIPYSDFLRRLVDDEVNYTAQ